MITIDSTTHRSQAHKKRPPEDNPPTAIIFHTGEGDSAADDIHELTHSGKSSHYYVTRKGKIFQFVDDSRRANHAGPNHYLNRPDWDDFSLGVETEHNKKQNWPQVQLDAISALFKH
ncbi:MAG TPA: N-acetylmuramoyl-L-alanine amidase [Longimicrobium sp.]|nr:N-acetylmuramoyl-L-alanine amidase [Longimicrobium sp.]